MKKIAMFGVLALLLVGTVLALDPTGFTATKNVVVKGDWEWTGTWQKTYPATTRYNLEVSSPLATESEFLNSDNLGTAWKYVGQSRITTNAATSFNNNLRAWTVNDPATTPATGGFTKFTYMEKTQSNNPDARSFSQISAYGFGSVLVNSTVITDEGSTQDVLIEINQ